ncbi:extracellular solute-binding protein [Paractinoplanes ferrugineus]|uniref:Sugar ABC transporter substrate-binding protein n=1 Tax=Paractinoplanes ferrugineus TaxID=113564 RepID=A0A919J6J9_9ACTN|nr:ABC transporter substrate-binding protein [Actinoplanes ferrugineus]GIE14978.1 sugar ABC transporter substrate-binding protein [Actinoplanes ferrugineus]
MTPSAHSLSRRRFLVLTGGAGTAAALAACGGTSQAPTAAPAGGNGGASYSGPNVTINFWNGWTGSDGETAQKMVDEFNKANPGVQVKMNVFQWADFYQKLPAAVQSGNGPDVGAMHIDDLPTQAAQQVIVPLDDIAGTLGLKESDYAPAVWTGGMYQGKRYGIPIDVHNLGLYYNKTVMERAGLDPEKPPTTKDEYMSQLETLKSKGIQGSWVSPFQFTGGFQFESLLWQFGGDVFNADASGATWNGDPGVQALTWMVDLVKNGYSPKNVGQDADYLSLKNGRNVFNWQGIWQVNDVAALTTYKIGTAPLPKIGSTGGVWGNSHQFVLPRKKDDDANKSNASRFFINWFTQHSADWAKSAKVPARNDLAQSADFKAIPGLSSFAGDVRFTHFPPSVAGIGDALAQLYTGVQSAVLLKQDPAAALDSAADKANKILADNKKKYGA